MISIICNYGSNGHENFFVSRSGAVGRGVENKVCYGQALIDCAKIIFNIIRFHKHNLIHLSSEKKNLQRFLSAYGHIHGNWVPLEMNVNLKIVKLTLLL